MSPYLSRTIALMVPVVRSAPLVPPAAVEELISERMTHLHDGRRVDRSQPPVGDQEPEREQQLTEEGERRDAGELEGEDGAHGVEGVAGTGDDEQRTDDLGDEVGPER